MKILCEVCNGDLLKEGDFFVCQQCGCKYSLDSIKKKFSGESHAEAMNSQIDRISTYKELIAREIKNSNYEAVHRYCRNILDLDLKNSFAWYYEGLMLLRLMPSVIDGNTKDALSALESAIAYCDSNGKDEIKRFMVRDLQNFQEEYISKAIYKYANTLDEDSAGDVIKSFAVFMLFSQKSIKDSLGINVVTDEFYMSAWENIADALTKIWKNQLYGPSEKLSTYDGSRWDFIRKVAPSFLFAQRGYSMFLTDDKFQEPSDYYKRRIEILDSSIIRGNYLISNGGWTPDFCEQLRKLSVTPSRMLLSNLQDEVNKIEGEKKAKATKKYWEMNPQEKKQLEELLSSLGYEVNTLTLELDDLEGEIKDLPEISLREAVLQDIRSKEVEFDNLWFFQKKEKEALQEKIQSLRNQDQELYDKEVRKEKALQDKIDAVKQKIKDKREASQKIRNRLVDPINNRL